ncbi:DUF1330 domain-containing protein [Novosphingopyxis sp.]|uniref:DUF1330 domain-containing protein n=1 Tax=Novosphingopyxis sp. TaxID=2709690 RepID=UPI003B5A343F
MTDRHVDPERAQFETFKALPRDVPIEMLNLVRFREAADYPADHALAGKGLSGADAYRNYGKESGPVFARVGGSIVYRGGFETVLIGPGNEQWDAVFVARYPDAAAFLEMVTDEAYRKAVVHRQAAVATSRLIRLAPREIGGEGFA